MMFFSFTIKYRNAIDIDIHMEIFLCGAFYLFFVYDITDIVVIDRLGSPLNGPICFCYKHCLRSNVNTITSKWK